MKNYYFIIIVNLLFFLDLSNISDIFLIRIIPLFAILSFLVFKLVIKEKVNKRIFPVQSLLLIFLLLTVIRGIIFSSFEEETILYKMFRILSIVLFVFIIYHEIYRRMGFDSPVTVFNKILIFPMIIVSFLNLLFFALGLVGSGPEIGDAVILSYFGISLERVHFFLAQGINSYGAFAGLLLALSLIGYFKVARHNIYISGIILSTISLVLTDSRGPIVYSLFILLVLIIFTSEKTSPKFLWVVPVISIVGPFIILGTLSFLATTPFAEYLARSSEDLVTGNSRSFIWAISASEFLDFKFQHIFGFGEYGHYGSGVSQVYGMFFNQWQNGGFMHPHNTIISFTLDYGYFGLVLLLMLQIYLLNIVKTYWIKFHNILIFILTALMYYNLVGIGETLLGFYYQNMFLLFILIVLFSFSVRLRIRSRLFSR